MDQEPRIVPDIEGKTNLDENNPKYSVGRIALNADLGGEQPVETEPPKPKLRRGLPIM